jgi:hypothetical protein
VGALGNAWLTGGTSSSHPPTRHWRP